jgi:hypothetical protein
MADQENIDNTRRQNELLDVQFSILEQLSRQAQQRVVFEGEVSDEIAEENDFLRQQLIVRNNLNKGNVKQLTTQKELNKAASQNLGIARSIQSVTASELGSRKLLEKIEKDKAKVQGNINFLKKQSLEIDKQQAFLNQRVQTLKGLEKKALDEANEAEKKGNLEKADNLRSRVTNLGIEAKTYQAQFENNNAIQDSLNQQVDLSNKLLNELEQVETVSKAIANDGFLSIFNTLKDVINLIPGLRNLLPGFDQAAESYREALVLQEDMGLDNKQRSLLDKNLEAYKKGTKQPGGLNKEFMGNLPKELQDQLKDKKGETLTGTAALARMKKLGLTFTSPLKAAMTALKGFMKKFLLLQFVASILKADKVAGDLAKSFNVTYQEALQIQTQMQGVAAASRSVFVTSAKVAETQAFINQLLGTTVMLTGEQLTTMTELREAAGFTNEELAGIFKLSATTGKEMETITGEVLAQAKISSTRLGVVINERDVVKEISKVSAATTLSLGKSAEAIADAVTTAKALGLELSKVDAIAGSILQFESSIEDELSAELLIGKELNLERARFAALNNDVKTLTEEIASNFGSAAEFGQMNRIQQEALAKAVGMNREELAQTLFVQEQLAGVSEEEAKRRERILNARIAEVGLAQAQQEIAEEGYATLEQQASVQDRINATTEKLGEVFATIAPLVLSIADILIDILEPVVTVLSPLFQGIAYAVGLIAEGLATIKPLLQVIGVLAGIVAVAYAAIAAAAAIAGAFTNPIKFAVGAGLALAGVGLVSRGIKSAKADDLMSPPTAGSGYGDRILVGKEGTYALNNRDTIQASTVNSSPQSAAVVETKLYIDNEAFAQASSKSFSKL